EWVHVQLHQQKGMISLSPPTICNSAQSAVEHYGGSFHYPYFRRVAVSVGFYDLCHSGTADCKGN
ncbi:hypothetical protein MZD89_22360, partial [Escherichia coli]|nr:hypothetical protein [Escherichia coli]